MTTLNLTKLTGQDAHRAVADVPTRHTIQRHRSGPAKLVNLGAIKSRQIVAKGSSAYGRKQQPSYSLTRGSCNARCLAASFPNQQNYG
jgi:hypothetical protein